MPLDKKAALDRLKQFDFSGLFTQELGWEWHKRQEQAEGFTLRAAAEKRGMVVFVCEPGPDGRIPDYTARRKIEKQIAKSAHEHILIFTDAAKTTQVWQWVRREPGRPAACREHTWHKNQPGEALIQKLQVIAFSLDEEDDLTIARVGARAKTAFDVDKITKRFYDRFQKEHEAFLAFITGIKEQADSEWYASLMLNRLMFIYFIQRKGFLDGDGDYLRNRLARMRETKGRDRFHSFYRHFLLRLFHEGLGGQARNKELDALLGKVPFLNGGLFEVHELEEENKSIQIPDEAFQRLFDFFDSYQWHLDERPLRADNEINPDVLGYIFEKYINQKQMGAYYTKEDITEYIGKYTIIPWLLSEAERHCAIAFKPPNEQAGSIWQLLSERPDRYIYPAVRHGVIDDSSNVIPESALPDFVQAGMRNPKARMFEKRYNLQQADRADPIRLVTETWREYAARRERCLELRGKLAADEIHAVNDLITWNLDIRQFAHDAIENCEGPELLRAFWRAIERISVLDPTCGSGAFLFAALNILEPLYEACLDRMQAFLDDLARSEDKSAAGKFSDFRDVLERVGLHPNRRHFILKSIVIGNLYGVDIMEEAVEICKLRLFLKLVAQVERTEDIEPLPDIDFNIRAGNTLVGFATHEEARRAIGSQMDFDNALQRIDTEAALADEDFKTFRREQTAYRMNASAHREAKQNLRKRLKSLAAELDGYLAGVYGMDAAKPKEFTEWHESHQPFHWFVEFYGIMQSGGFCVIIGNPPYIEYSKVREHYRLLNESYSTLSCGNLYAFVIERCRGLSCSGSGIGMIVQLSAVCTDRMTSLQTLYLSAFDSVWSAGFDDRPAKLFDGLEHIRASIILGIRGATPAAVYSTILNRWPTTFRHSLFHSLAYHPIADFCVPGSFPKIGSPRLAGLLVSVRSLRESLAHLHREHSSHIVYYYRSPLYWIRSMDFLPHFSSNQASRSVHHFKNFPVRSANDKAKVGCILNSSLFYLWFIVYGNGRNVAIRDITTLPVPPTLLEDAQMSSLDTAFSALMEDYSRHSVLRSRNDGVEYQEFYPSKSKALMDEIDRTIASHYGFTDEELDFIVNYDIKYRMGADSEDET